MKIDTPQWSVTPQTDGCLIIKADRRHFTDEVAYLRFHPEDLDWPGKEKKA